MQKIDMIRLGAAALALTFAAMPAVAADKKVRAAPSSWGAAADDKSFGAMMAAGFQDAGIVKTSVLKQDETQIFCSNPAFAESKEAAKQRAAIEAANMAFVKWPSDGVFLGDHKEGEKIAQSGRGLTWTDKADQVNGGNCYNCHQLSKKEISFGTIGPTLYNYGKTRSATNPEDVKYVWARIYDAKATNACSNMPRGGHMGILNEKQIKDLVALLLDPASPVNQ